MVKTSWSKYTDLDAITFFNIGVNGMIRSASFFRIIKPRIIVQILFH